MPLGVIIAGGKSSRMRGQNKLLLPLGDKAMIDRVIEKITPSVEKLYLNCNDENTAKHVSLEVVPDAIDGRPDIGPVGGLYTALILANSLGVSKVITAPGDTPFLPDNFAEKLRSANEADVVVASSRGRRHPLLALWKTDVLSVVREGIEAGDYKMMSLLDRLNLTIVIWDEDPDPFLNVNTAEDYEIASKRFKTT